MTDITPVKSGGPLLQSPEAGVVPPSHLSAVGSAEAENGQAIDANATKSPGKRGTSIYGAFSAPPRTAAQNAAAAAAQNAQAAAYYNEYWGQSQPSLSRRGSAKGTPMKSPSPYKSISPYKYTTTAAATPTSHTQHAQQQQQQHHHGVAAFGTGSGDGSQHCNGSNLNPLAALHSVSNGADSWKTRGHGESWHHGQSPAVPTTDSGHSGMNHAVVKTASRPDLPNHVANQVVVPAHFAEVCGVEEKGTVGPWATDGSQVSYQDWKGAGVVDTPSYLAGALVHPVSKPGYGVNCSNSHASGSVSGNTSTKVSVAGEKYSKPSTPALRETASGSCLSGQVVSTDGRVTAVETDCSQASVVSSSRTSFLVPDTSGKPPENGMLDANTIRKALETSSVGPSAGPSKERSGAESNVCTESSGDAAPSSKEIEDSPVICVCGNFVVLGGVCCRGEE